MTSVLKKNLPAQPLPLALLRESTLREFFQRCRVTIGRYVDTTPDFIVAPGDRILRHTLADPYRAFPSLRGKPFIYVGLIDGVEVDGVALIRRGEFYTIDVYDACGYRIAKGHIASAEEIFVSGDELIGLVDELRARRAGRGRE